ncbi:hypothetical protein [Ancylobacter sp.]|uniref:hypothetical protein n=1 Tax=Ancylobacter sp. TaxID=1872567 RepID=UPI003BA8FD6A
MFYLLHGAPAFCCTKGPMLATQTISETLVHLPMYLELGSRVKDGFLGLLRMRSPSSTGSPTGP